MKILACDSGVERTGYALFDTLIGGNNLVAYDCIFTDKKLTIENRLFQLRKALQALIDEYKPSVIVFERLFFQQNQTTGIMVAQAQGVLLSLAGEYGIKAGFLAPTEIKHIVTGYGKSDKKAIQKMIMLLLHLEKVPTPDDVSDAIACGLAYCTINKLI